MPKAKALTLTGKASVSYFDEKKEKNVVIRFGDEISASDLKALPKRQQEYFTEVGGPEGSDGDGDDS